MPRIRTAKLLGILLTCVMLTSMFVVFPETAKAATTIYVPDNYPTIQAAVNAASSGDTIIVRDGTYTENVNVNKRLTIRSQNGVDLTIIQAANSGDHVFDLATRNVTVQGFTIRGHHSPAAGIHLSYGYCRVLNNFIYSGPGMTGIGIIVEDDNDFISGNTIDSNYWGIEIGNRTNTITITGNTITHNWSGILCGSSSGIITSNIFSNNAEDAIYIYTATNLTLTANMMTGNGIQLHGDIGQVTSHNIDTTNSVNGKPVYYYKNKDEGLVPPDAGQIILANCRNIIVTDQHMDRINHGRSFTAPIPSAISILYCSQCLIEDNWVQGTIGLYSSVNNTINSKIP